MGLMVGVKDDDDLAEGVRQPDVERARLAPRCARIAVHDPNLVIRVGARIEEGAGPVGRGVVHDDELQELGRVVEAEKALKKALDDRLLVLAGHEHRHARLVARVEKGGGQLDRCGTQRRDRKAEVADEIDEEHDLQRGSDDEDEPVPSQQGETDEPHRNEDQEGPRSFPRRFGSLRSLRAPQSCRLWRRVRSSRAGPTTRRRPSDCFEAGDPRVDLRDRVLRVDDAGDAHLTDADGPVGGAVSLSLDTRAGGRATQEAEQGIGQAVVAHGDKLPGGRLHDATPNRPARSQALESDLGQRVAPDDGGDRLNDLRPPPEAFLKRPHRPGAAEPAVMDDEAEVVGEGAVDEVTNGQLAR